MQWQWLMASRRGCSLCN